MWELPVHQSKTTVCDMLQSWWRHWSGLKTEADNNDRLNIIPPTMTWKRLRVCLCLSVVASTVPIHYGENEEDRVPSPEDIRAGKPKGLVVPDPRREAAQNWVLITLYVLDRGDVVPGPTKAVSYPASVFCVTLHSVVKMKV